MNLMYIAQLNPDLPYTIVFFGQGFKNFTPSWTIVNCSILWVKFSALRRGGSFPDKLLEQAFEKAV
jgi:hypothetical protein